MFAKYTRLLALAGLCVLWFARLSFAQYTTTSLSGTVLDPSGAPITGADITVEGMDNGLHLSPERLETQARFRSLPYRLDVIRYKYKSPASRSIFRPVSIWQSDSPPACRSSFRSETCLKRFRYPRTRSSSIRSQERSDSSSTRRKSWICRSMGRQPQALLFLTAGAVNENRELLPCKLPGWCLSWRTRRNVNGGGPRSVNFQMDGAGHNDTYLNTNLPFPNPDAVQQFSVDTDNLSAQYGIGAGAVVNIITKSGTNQIHGDASNFFVTVI